MILKDVIQEAIPQRDGRRMDCHLIAIISNDHTNGQV